MKKIVTGLFLIISIFSFANSRGNTVSLRREAMKQQYEKVVYKPNRVYEVFGDFFKATAIVFGNGEEVRTMSLSDPGWKAQINSNQIYVKPPEEEFDIEGMRVLPPESTLFVSTTKRNYYFKLRVTGDGAYNPVIQFIYPDEEAMLIQNYELQKREEENRKIKISMGDIENVNNRYTWNKKYAWSPSNVLDDGEKTYIFLSLEDKSVPTFYIKKNKELEIALFRIKENKNGQKVLIIDDTFKEGILALHKQKITIVNKARKR